MNNYFLLLTIISDVELASIDFCYTCYSTVSSCRSFTCSYANQYTLSVARRGLFTEEPHFDMA